tara:strand:+ start:162 stop:347 length:186 start_codon:yes stop_codon:yes gene_type:complete
LFLPPKVSLEQPHVGAGGEAGGIGASGGSGGLDVPVQSALAAIGSAPTVTTASNSLLIVHT